MATLLFTTNPGLEDLVELELREVADAAGVDLEAVECRADGWPGRVRVHSPASLEALRALTPGLCSVHHVLAPLWAGPLPEDGPEGLARIAEGLDWSVLSPFETFRGSCERHGQHDFGSPDVERAVGSVVDALTPLKVKLRGWDVAVRCDVRDRRAAIAVQLTQRALSRDRLVRPYLPRTSLKSTVAWAMVRLLRQGGGLGEQPVICDPFCGSGTLLQEVALQLPGARLVGADSFAGHLRGVRHNLAAAGLAEREALLFAGDARELALNLAARDLPEGSVDGVVCNPPFGLRLGSQLDFERFYGIVLRELARVLRPGGRVVILVVKRGIFNRRVNRLGAFAKVHVRVVEMGRVFPGLFVLERNDRPVSGPPADDPAEAPHEAPA